jgi:hypothetical protein
MKKRNRHIGSSLDDVLKEEGVLEETRAAVLKETLAWQVQQAMEKDKISKVEMACSAPQRGAMRGRTPTSIFWRHSRRGVAFLCSMSFISK